MSAPVKLSAFLFPVREMGMQMSVFECVFPESTRWFAMNRGCGFRGAGNSREIFERDFGAGSPLRLERRLNNLWTHGGLMYALPLRHNKQ
jgi:hypothetical protein